MAQTKAGALKVQAKKAGLTVAEYRRRVARGLKRCYKCGEWRQRKEFNSDSSRYDGLVPRCRLCRNGPGTKSEKLKRAWLVRRETFIPPMKGKRMTAVSRAKMSKAAKNRQRQGRPHNRLGKKHSKETKLLLSKISRERTPRGEAHYAYSHGRAQRNLNGRRVPEYAGWRTAVFERDSYTCQQCGDAKGGNLQAHHIKSFAENPDLWFDVSNGITLCLDCHEKVHLKPIPSNKDLRRRKKHKCV